MTSASVGSTNPGSDSTRVTSIPGGHVSLPQNEEAEAVAQGRQIKETDLPANKLENGEIDHSEVGGELKDEGLKSGKSTSTKEPEGGSLSEVQVDDRDE